MKNIIKRRISKKIYVGKVPVGGNSIISVQSMTNTNTNNIYDTVNQIKVLKKAGVDLIRISVPTIESAESFKKIKKKTDIPLIADIHFDYRIAIKCIEYGADCIRINPGNIGNKSRIRKLIDCALHYNIPIRIGINSGSLESDLQKKYGNLNPLAFFESAIRNIEYFDLMNFNQFKVSVKSSDVLITVKSYRLLAKETEYPLHIGITEAGGLRLGSIKSAIGLGLLLSEGIGDTIRVSLAADPVEEVKVAFDILKSLRIRSRGINFIACPTCSRQEFDVINTVKILEERLQDITTPMDVSIIGCIVNGVGEAITSSIGLSGLRSKSILYEDGKHLSEKINNNDIINKLENRIRKKVQLLKKNNI